MDFEDCCIILSTQSHNGKKDVNECQRSTIDLNLTFFFDAVNDKQDGSLVAYTESKSG